MAPARAPSAMEPARTYPHSTAKTNDKSTFLRKNGLGGINDVVIASVHSEKIRLKKLMMIIKRQWLILEK